MVLHVHWYMSVNVWGIMVLSSIPRWWFVDVVDGTFDTLRLESWVALKSK
jgi:hypothetical protein